MAIAYRSTTSTAYGLRTNTTISAPAGAATGTDIITVAIDVGNSAAVSVPTPSGWTLAGDVTYSNADPWFVHLLIFVRVHDGASSWTFNHTSGYSNCCAVAWQGVDTTTPLDATASTNSGTLAASCAFATLTTVTSGAQLIGARGSWDGNAITPPASWNERLDTPVLWVGDFATTSAGATGAITVAPGNSGNSPWGTVMAVLRPGTGGGAPALPPILTMQTRRAY